MHRTYVARTCNEERDPKALRRGTPKTDQKMCRSEDHLPTGPHAIPGISII
jgi:hypothetical protein